MSPTEAATRAAVVRDTELNALTDLPTVLELCAAGRLRASEKTRRPAAATVATVTEALAGGDIYPDQPIAAFAWPLLVQAGGLARIETGRLRLTPKGRAARTEPAPAIRQIWARWPQHAPIDEFSRIEAIKGQRAANVLTAARGRRQTVADAMAALPPGEWVEVDDLFATMRRQGRHPTVARSERARWKLYIEHPEYGSLGYDDYHRWSVVEGRYTLAVLFEYAATLGLLDVEYEPPAQARDDFRHMWGADWLDALSRYDGLRAVRLTTLGAYACGLHPNYTPPARARPARALEVLSNGDVVVTGALSVADQLILDVFATRTAERVWAVTAASLLGALDSGRAPTEFAAFLRERAGHELPGPLCTLLDDVETRAAQLRDLGTARIIECADPTVALLVSRDRALRALCTPLGDRHLAIKPGADERFRSGLRKLGYALGPGK